MKKTILLLSTTIIASSLLFGCAKEDDEYTQSKKERDYIENKSVVSSKPFTEKEKEKIQEILKKEQKQSSEKVSDESGKKEEAKTGALQDLPELEKSEFIDDETFKLYSDYTLFGKDDTILKDVEPKKIFKLYYHSVNVGDLGTQYYLLYQDDKLVNYLEFTNTYAEKNRKSEQIIAEYLKKGANVDVRVNGDSAEVILTGGGMKGAFFQMKKNDKGVWKLNLMEYYKK